MNILPHKSWNVWNKKNIEKVRNDEAKFNEEEDRKRKRQQEIVHVQFFLLFNSIGTRREDGRFEESEKTTSW